MPTHYAATSQRKEGKRHVLDLKEIEMYVESGFALIASAGSNRKQLRILFSGGFQVVDGSALRWHPLLEQAVDHYNGIDA